MKIKYNLEDNYFKYYNEANGIIANKKRLLKKNNIKIHPYIHTISLLTLLYIILAIFLLIILSFIKFNHSTAIISIYIALVFFVYFICLISFYIGYKNKLNSKSGILEINKIGIIDKSNNGNVIEFSYNNIDLIVITNDLIVFCTNTFIMFFIGNKDKNKIIDYINKYANIKIIDRSSDIK